MANSETSTGLNIEKKQSVLGIFQDVYTLIYCALIIPISIYNIFNQTNIIDWKIDLFSYIYFAITGIINIYYRETSFIIHHIVCIGLIFVGNYNQNLNYYLWLSNCYLAEISNIFLSGKNILRVLRINKFIENTKSYENLNDILFVILYFTIRMFYLIPYSLRFLYLNLNSNSNINYYYFICANVFTMCVLNLYWSYLIVLKVLRTLSKNKNN